MKPKTLAAREPDVDSEEMHASESEAVAAPQKKQKKVKAAAARLQPYENVHPHRLEPWTTGEPTFHATGTFLLCVGVNQLQLGQQPATPVRCFSAQTLLSRCTWPTAARTRGSQTSSDHRRRAPPRAQRSGGRLHRLRDGALPRLDAHS
jgi:hypothetical protein